MNERRKTKMTYRCVANREEFNRKSCHFIVFRAFCGQNLVRASGAAVPKRCTIDSYLRVLRELRGFLPRIRLMGKDKNA